jgi:hypothetical protein
MLISNKQIRGMKTLFIKKLLIILNYLVLSYPFKSATLKKTTLNAKLFKSFILPHFDYCVSLDLYFSKAIYNSFWKGSI